MCPHTTIYVPSCCLNKKRVAFQVSLVSIKLFLIHCRLGHTIFVSGSENTKLLCLRIAFEVYFTPVKCLCFSEALGQLFVYPVIFLVWLVFVELLV